MDDTLKNVLGPGMPSEVDHLAQPWKSSRKKAQIKSPVNLIISALDLYWYKY